MPKQKWRNASDQTLHLHGVGSVEPGATVETEEPIVNANFERVDDKPPAKQAKAAASDKASAGLPAGKQE